MLIEGIDARVVAPERREERCSTGDALGRLAAGPHVVCHAVHLIERLALAGDGGREAVARAHGRRHFDIAELFAFVVPAVVATPTITGFARALGLRPGGDEAETAGALVAALLDRLASPHLPAPRETLETANFLARSNWPWAPAVATAIRTGTPGLDAPAFATGLNVWDRIEDWQDDGPRPPGSHHPVAPAEAQALLGCLLGPGAEARPQQVAYCAEAAGAFAARENRHENHVLLAEAGTGLGKTLGYLAPAWLWARRNAAPVWISTFTKNLQRQLEQESQRLVPDPAERRQRIVVRKGRENYLCLLNLQEVVGRLGAANPKGALLAALIARWARFSRDGDMVGGDFPAWLLPLAGDGEARPQSPMALGLTDRRGECIYAACPHYRKCFIERAVRAARKADIVIANHALVLHQIAVDQALGAPAVAEDQEAQPARSRIVFDEGHHLFDAADSAFSGHLTGQETAELRRWIRGPEARGRRGRGLAERLGDLLVGDGEAEDLLQAVLEASLALPGPGWTSRLHGGQPQGITERFLALVRQQVLARTEARGPHAAETDCRPLIDGLADAAGRLAAKLIDLKRPMSGLARRLAKKLDEEASEHDSAERARIEALSRSLMRRSELMIGGFIDMLGRLIEEPDPRFVDWFALDHQFGRESDAGLHSHWLDPSEPLAAAVLAKADGVIITSATLKDRPPEAPEDWRNAEMRTGVVHLPYPVRRTTHDSPFDYPAAARVLAVNDVAREDMDQVAAAYRELFLAAGGGGLGLFTAIARLRAVHQRIIQPLARAGLTLYAQHVDPMDPGTLVDMFRADDNACLLGTDAMRDGVDVPGTSLRLIVLERVPWPQPTILERARRGVFGGNAYQDMVVRLRLRQGFGRLIRRAGDRGVFVILDPRLASRFQTAFPDGVAIRRVGLLEAIDTVADFLGPLAGPARASI
jgi:ATP-dependent DNA helicase DinG